MYIHMHITAEGLCDQKSSYKNLSDFGRLQALFLPPDSPTQLQTVQFPYLHFDGI